jgi:hypothetical protein
MVSGTLDIPGFVWLFPRFATRRYMDGGFSGGRGLGFTSGIDFSSLDMLIPSPTPASCCLHVEVVG